MNLLFKFYRALRNWYQAHRERKNLSQVNSCGEGTELRGTIDKRHPGSFISIGQKSRIDGYVVTEIETSRVIIGNNCLLGPRSAIDCVDSVTIEDNVMISYDCIIADADNHSTAYSKRAHDLERWRKGTHEWADVNRAPILIKEGACIGARAIILKGVTIGEGSVVGMGSVVTRDVAPYTIVLGNPARAIKEIPPDER